MFDCFVVCCLLFDYLVVCVFARLSDCLIVVLLCVVDVGLSVSVFVFVVSLVDCALDCLIGYLSVSLFVG